jgi:hypothetical protein
MKTHRELNKLTDKQKLEFVKKQISFIGCDINLKRIGDNNMRIDATSNFDKNKKAIFSIEFGNDHVSVPRKILEDFAVLHNRYNIIKENIVPFSILQNLPNKRSEYYQIIDDIKNVTNISIYTLTLEAIENIKIKRKTIYDFNLNEFFISKKNYRYRFIKK